MTKKEKKHLYYLSHREEIRQKHHLYYLAHREELNAREKARRDARRVVDPDRPMIQRVSKYGKVYLMPGRPRQFTRKEVSLRWYYRHRDRINLVRRYRRSRRAFAFSKRR